MWQATDIQHSINCSVRLHVRSVGQQVEVVLTTLGEDGKQSCLEHDLLDGKVSELVFDQNGTAISWFETAEPATIGPKTSMFDARKRDGHHDTLDFLKYEIANAINASLSNRGFSRAAKRMLPGTWDSDDIRLTIDADGTYTIVERKPERRHLRGIPVEGTWSIGSNMLWFMKHGSGERIQLVNITETRIFLPGGHGALHYVLQRAG
jgi:hypothetical protein